MCPIVLRQFLLVHLLKAIRSFKNGASGGPDGLLPQHLKDMTGDELGETASKLLDTLVTFFNTIIYPGKVPHEVIETFYGANLIALGKEDGDAGKIPPIKVNKSFSEKNLVLR